MVESNSSEFENRIGWVEEEYGGGEEDEEARENDATAEIMVGLIGTVVIDG